MSEFDTKIPIIKKPRLDHLNRQIPPEAISFDKLIESKEVNMNANQGSRIKK